MFILSSSKKFSAKVGSKGNSKGWASHSGKPRGEGGDNGTPSSFEIVGVVNITADGGKGGGGGQANECHWSQNGARGADGGNGKNAGAGYVRIYKYPLYNYLILYFLTNCKK